MKRTIFLGLIFSLSIFSIAAQKKSIDKQKALEHAVVSFCVKDVNTGKIVAEHNPELSATPASITKIITTSTALEILGPDFKFQTKLEYDGNLSNGILHGNLYIKGGGDPTLGSIYLGDSNFITKWAKAIADQGIKSIQGNIVADASCYDDEPIPNYWSWEDMGNYYAAGVFGLSLYDNTYNVTLKSNAPGTLTQIVVTSPEIPDMLLDNRVKSMLIGYDSAYFYGIPYSNHRLMRGGIPANKTRFTVRGDIPNPPLLLSQLFYNALKTNGIKISGHATNMLPKVKNERKILYTYDSPSLSTIIRLTNFKSNNMYAEHIFKQLSYRQYGLGTNSRSLRIVENFWKSKGISTDGVYLYDGCGLSPTDAYPSEFLTNILVYMATQSPNKEYFINSLPMAGREGTVKYMFKNTPLYGKIKMKSGSINNVQCYAGYILNKNNTEYAFTIMINRYSCSRTEIRKIIEDWILEATNK